MRMEEQEYRKSDTFMDMEVVRSEFADLHIKLCSALSAVSLLSAHKAALTDQLVRATARIAELERDGDGPGKPQ